MASNVRDISVDVLATDKTKGGTASAGKNFDTLKRKVDDTGKSGEGLGTKFKNGLAGLSVPVLGAAAALSALAIQAGKLASDSEQSLGATQTIFGKAADSVIASSQGAAEKYGLSANSYRDSANLVGSLLKNQGVASDKLAGQTDKLVGKAADLSAVFGGSTADAVEALGSALKGEFDPLEKYGITLTQSAIDAQALTEAHVGSKAAFDKLTPAQQKAAKSAATLALINQQSADSTGQFAAQSDTAAEKTQILKAKYENMAASVGDKLLPIFDKLLTVGGKIMEWAKNNKPTVIALAIAIGVLTIMVLAMNIAMYANPISLIILGLALLAVGVVYCYTHFETFRKIVDAVWSFLKAFYTFMFNFYVGLAKFVADFAVATFGKFMDVVNFVKGLPGKIKSAASGMFDGIKDAFKGALNWIIDKWNNLSFKLPEIDTHIPGVGKVGGFTLNTPDIPRFSGDPGGSFAGTGSGGRTAPPTPVSVNSAVTVNLDGKPFRAMVTSTVDDNQKRSDWRAKVGRR